MLPTPEACQALHQLKLVALAPSERDASRRREHWLRSSRWLCEPPNRSRLQLGVVRSVRGQETERDHVISPSSGKKGAKSQAGYTFAYFV